MSPSAARRRRGPAPTGCERSAARCKQPVGRTSPPVSLASPASHLPALAALGRGGVAEFRNARSRGGALWNSSPRLRRGEVSPSAARRRRGPAPTGCERSAARCKQPVGRTSPPSRWLRQRATSPPSLRSVEEESRIASSHLRDLWNSSPPSLRSVEEESRIALRRACLEDQRSRFPAASAAKRCARERSSETAAVPPSRSVPASSIRAASRTPPASSRRSTRSP